MKKLVLIVGLLIGLVGGVRGLDLTIVKNDSLIIGLDSYSISTFYDFRREMLLVGGILPVIVYKDLLSLDTGIISNIKESRILVLGIGINLYELCRRAVGFKYMLSKPLIIGAYLGKDMQSRDTYSGIYAGVKFNL